MSLRIFQYFNNLFGAFAGKATRKLRFWMYPATFPFSDKNKIR